MLHEFMIKQKQEYEHRWAKDCSSNIVRKYAIYGST